MKSCLPNPHDNTTITVISTSKPSSQPQPTLRPRHNLPPRRHRFGFPLPRPVFFLPLSSVVAGPASSTPPISLTSVITASSSTPLTSPTSIITASYSVRNPISFDNGKLSKSSVALSPLSAEAQALREAISLAVNMGLARILFESDCLELIRAWVGRNGNKLAHTLAQMNKRNVLPGDWRWRPPLEQFGQEDGLLATEQIHLSNDVDLESFPPDPGIF